MTTTNRALTYMDNVKLISYDIIAFARNLDMPLKYCKDNEYIRTTKQTTWKRGYHGDLTPNELTTVDNNHFNK